jgi:hypothetical protein
MRGAEKRIPKYSAEARMMHAVRVSRRNIAMQAKCLTAHCDGKQQNHPDRPVIDTIHECFRFSLYFDEEQSAIVIHSIKNISEIISGKIT